MRLRSLSQCRWEQPCEAQMWTNIGAIGVRYHGGVVPNVQVGAGPTRLAPDLNCGSVVEERAGDTDPRRTPSPILVETLWTSGPCFPPLSRGSPRDLAPRACPEALRDIRISRSMYRQLLRDPEIQQWLEDMGCEDGLRVKLFDKIDRDGNGVLECTELVTGIVDLLRGRPGLDVTCGPRWGRSRREDECGGAFGAVHAAGERTTSEGQSLLGERPGGRARYVCQSPVWGRERAAWCRCVGLRAALARSPPGSRARGESGAGGGDGRGWVIAHQTWCRSEWRKRT